MDLKIACPTTGTYEYDPETGEHKEIERKLPKPIYYGVKICCKEIESILESSDYNIFEWDKDGVTAWFSARWADCGNERKVNNCPFCGKKFKIIEGE